MRTALISAVKRTDAGQLRADLMLGGRSVLAWQVELARGLKCERIICLCENAGENVLSLQQLVEQTGGEFHAIRSNLQLASLIRADDELIMLMDGLLADREVIARFTSADGMLKKGIATIPANHMLGGDHHEDFELIDRERRWAGFAEMRAGQVHKIADLPPDSDAMSLLLRLGLQSQLECRELSSDALEGDRWLLAVTGDGLAEREKALISQSSTIPSLTGPGRALAASLVKQITPRWLENGVEVSAATAAFLLVFGVILAGFGFGTAGLGVAAAGAFVGAISNSWAGLRQRLWSTKRGGRLSYALHIGTDLAATLILILVYGLAPNLVTQIALPILTVGIAHYAERVVADRPAAFWQDRSLHLAFFAGAAAMGFIGEAMAVFSIAALAQLLIRR